MKRWAKSVALILVSCLLCLCFTGCGSSDTEKPEAKPLNTKRINELVQQINANIEVKTYKNTLVMYEELIELEPNNVKWYVGLADAYRMLGQSSKYKKMCKEIVEVFPNEKTGYLMLIKLYAANGKDRYVISTYNSAPTVVQNDEDFLSIYQESEWVYRYRDSRYNSISDCSKGCYVFERNGLYGYKKNNFTSTISAKFTVARPFIEDYAAVYKDNEWYFIDTAGYRVLATKEKLEDLYSLSQGYAVAKINGKYGYIDSSFNKYTFELEDATSFYNGVAAVKKNGKWALIDNKFTLLTSFVYEDVVRDDANICSREGVVFLRLADEYHMLNTKGKEITSQVFADANLFYSEYAAVKQNGKWGFIDKSGNTVIDFIYEDASSFASGIAAVKQNGKWGCVIPSGKVVLPFEYDDASVTSDNGVVVVKVKDKYRFLQFRKFDV